VSVRGRVRRAWRALREPLPADEQAVVRRRVRQRYRRWLRWRRVWRRRARWIDPGKPPISVLRWLAVLGIALAWWAQGAVTSPVHGWLPYAIIAGALILPDVAGFAVGGLRVDMRRTQEELARLRQDVNAQARASASVGPIFITRDVETGLEAYGRLLRAEREPQETYRPRYLDTGGTAEVPSRLWPTFASPRARSNRYGLSTMPMHW
jgi:hypothetical protein